MGRALAKKGVAKKALQGAAKGKKACTTAGKGAKGAKGPAQGRKGRGRFQRAQDALDQLDDISDTQQALSKGKVKDVIIDETTKSRHRMDNALKKVRNLEDAFDEFD